MNSSPEKDKQRSVFDVHAIKKGHERKKRKTIKDLIYGRNVINLRPNFRFRHPWILTIIIFIIVATAFLGVKDLLTRGAVKDFSPTTCLGSWENPSAAAGIPETTLAASSSFSPTNSAVYDVTGTQIYCGGFVPADFSTSGTLTSVTLSLVWQVGDTPYAPTSAADEISSTTIDSSTISSPVSSSTLDTSTDTNEVASSSPDSNSTDTSTPTSFLPFKSFFASIINRAFAQDNADASNVNITTDGGDAATPPPSDSPSVDTSTPVIILGPPIIANLASDSSTISSTLPDDVANGDNNNNGTSSATPSSTLPVIVPPPAPDENFLEVSYSTDGQLWIQLAEVNVENWPNLTVQLPISSWSNLQNLQIKVQGVPTTQDPIPPVYLDGMVVEANYDLAPDVPNATSTYSQFLTDQSSYTLGQPISIVGAPPESFIEIYSFNDPNNPGIPENDYGIQIDNIGKTVIDSNTLIPGNYILVNTFESGACNEYSLSQCEIRDDYISQIPITVTSDH